jgi:uncharacterized protein (TIGR03663 family)
METSKITTELPYSESEIPVSNNRGWLARTLAQAFPLTWETALVIAIATAAIFTRLWELGARVMSHDESLHVYYSWLLATGKGFAHNPMMHGPFLFDATALMNLLFGASDFTSRLVPAFLGIFIVVAIPQLLKPWLGQVGSLVASILLLISPFILYFSRYIRHDIQVIAWALLAVIAIFRYLVNRSERDLLLLTAAVALMLSTMEVAFIYLALFAGYLVLSAITKHHFVWKELLKSAEFDLLIVLVTLGAFFSSPIALLILNPLATRFTGAPFVDMQVLNAQGIEWAAGAPGLRLWGLFAVFSIAGAALGLWWNWKRWLKLVVLFTTITLPLFTTFFTNPAGFGTGFIGSLGYWLSQQGVARGSQPGYYYLIVFPLYEYLPLIGGLVAAIVFGVRRKTLSGLSRAFIPFLFWWSVWIFVALSLAGEKMPWLSTHIAIPLILLTSWWVGRLLENVRLSSKNIRERWQTVFRWSALGLMGILLILTVRTSLAVNYVNYDYTTEWIDYAHGAPGVKLALNDIAAIANHTGVGSDLKIAYDDEVSWPMTWYLRDYPNQAFYGAQPNRQALDAPIVIAGPKNWAKVEAILGSRYHRFELIRMWWPLEDYKNLSWERIRSAITDPSMRFAMWNILWSRDFRPYAELTGQALNPPANWPLAEKMRVYVKKEVASQMLHMSLGSAILEDLPEPVDAYAAVQVQVEPAQVISDASLNAPRGLAVAPDGSIWVADTGNSRIVRFDATGEVVNSWGERTPDGQNPPAPGTFTEPWGVAIDSQGNIFVADTWNHRVQKFDSTGKFLLEWGQAGQLNDGSDRLWGPRGIAVSPDGRVYLTDTGNKRVAVFDTNGKSLFEFGTEGEGLLDEPVGIAIGPDGRVYVADTWNMRVAVFTAEGDFQTSWPVQGWASDSLENKPYLAVDGQNRVYITDPEGYRIIVFSSQGAPLAVFGQYGPEDDSFGLPVGLAIGMDGNLWVADAGNHRLEKIKVWDLPQPPSEDQ